MSKTKFIIATVAIACLSSVAVADGYEPVGKGFAPPPVYSWTGFYIGAHVGWERKDIEGSDDVARDLNDWVVDDDGYGFSIWEDGEWRRRRDSQNIDGWIGGGQFGYNHQFGHVVIGTEISGSWGDVGGNGNCFSGHALDYDEDGSPPWREKLDCRVQQDWTVQWLSKLGMAFGKEGRMLTYLTGGVAISDLSINRKVAYIEECGDCDYYWTEGVKWSGDTTAVGFVLGAGFQYAIHNSLSLGVEYLHAEYRDSDITAKVSEFWKECEFGSCEGDSWRVDRKKVRDEFDTDTIRVVLNYKFHHAEPVVPLK